MVLELATIIRAAGGRAMLVGGCVRDELMGIQPKDWDLEIYGVKPERLTAILNELVERSVPQYSDPPLMVEQGRTSSGNDVPTNQNFRVPSVNIVGEAFAVYKIGRYLDVSIPRRDKKSGRGHRGFVIEGDPYMSFEEACSRRDFTINAILKDPLTGEIIDPFDGQADIRRECLRHVSDLTFADDSLRVLRAAQFAARLEFDIDETTVELCNAIDISDLPKERIWGELEKLLLQAEQPSIGVKWLYDLGVVRQIFPELQALIGVPQEPEWHPEGDVDVHTLMVVDEARKLIEGLDHPRSVAVMVGALCHDLGKPPTTEYVDGRVRSRGHDEAGVEPTLNLLDTLGIFTLDGYDVRGQIVQLVRYHLKPGEFFNSKSPVGDGAFRRLAAKVEPDLLYRVAKADSLGRNPEWLPEEKWFGSEAQEWFIEKVRALQIEKKAPEPILMGRHLIDLGLTPSPQFKKIIDAIYELQMDDEISDLTEAIAAAKKLIDQSGVDPVS